MAKRRTATILEKPELIDLKISLPDFLILEMDNEIKRQETTNKTVIIRESLFHRYYRGE